MKTTFISTLTLNGSPRAALPKLQSELAKATAELSSGSRADLGLDLGVKVGQSVALRQEQANLQALKDSNAISMAQLDTAEAAVEKMTSTANTFLQTLLAASPESSVTVIADEARSSLDSLIAAANSTDGRRYVFGGTNSGVKPINDYESGPKAAIDAAFLTEFGFSQTAPAVSTITPAQMTTFLDGAFADLFTAPGWSAWSNATDESRTALISPTETVSVSSSANDVAIQKLAMVYTMVGELGVENLPQDTLQVVIDRAREVVGTAVTDLTRIGAAIGTSQSRITNANEVMDRTLTSLDEKKTSLEGVDPAETKSRVDTLTTQIEMSYALTTQIIQLSIINYV